MPSFAELLAQGTAHAWLFIPSAILLGILHGLEPGHSKTMMAGFIVAIRGTLGQAVLLGLTATLSHTVIVWGIALTGMYLWQGMNTEALEPYFQLASGVIILAVAAWMSWRTWRDQHHHDHHHHHGHEHQDAHERAHAEDIRKRFANRKVTNWQIALFGLTGGLIPCPAAITVLLLCLQLQQFTLGAVLVLCFSIGLAITLVAVGVAAAWSVRHVGKHSSWFNTLASRAPYFSSALIAAVGLYVGIHGWLNIAPRF